MNVQSKSVKIYISIQACLPKLTDTLKTLGMEIGAIEQMSTELANTRFLFCYGIRRMPTTFKDCVLIRCRTDLMIANFFPKGNVNQKGNKDVDNIIPRHYNDGQMLIVIGIFIANDLIS